MTFSKWSIDGLSVKMMKLQSLITHAVVESAHVHDSDAVIPACGSI